VVPGATDAEEGETKTTITGRMETETEAALVGSASGAAITCTVAGDGGIEGAVYTPVEEIVPQAAPVQPLPVTLQEITRLGLEPEGGVSAAVYVVVLPASTDDGPITASEKELVILIVAVALLDESATLTAIRETFAGTGRICGAVYVPDESTVPHAAPVHPLPERFQVTDRLGLPAEFTVAVNGRTAPSSAGASCGEIETEMSLAMVTCAVELLVLSSTLVAVTEMESGVGRMAGAV
jgi:hypothetical protein